MSKRIICIVALSLFSLSSIAYSQNAEPKNSWWVNLGAGPALVGGKFGFTAGMVYSYKLEQSVISARMIGMTNYNPTALRIDPSNIKYRMSDYAILYGPLWQMQNSYFSLGAGIGFVRADDNVRTSARTTISLPFEMQLFWRPTDFGGLGIYYHNAFSFEKPLWGLMFCAQLGIWQ